MINIEKEHKDEVVIEGRLSDEHTHKDGTRGRDAYAAKVSYRDGEKVDEKDADWGHAHYDEDKGKEGD